MKITWSVIVMTLEWNNPPAFTCSRWTKEILTIGVKSVKKNCSSISIYNFEFVYWDLFIDRN